MNGGFEIGLLPKVKNLNLRYFKAIVDNFILFCWYRSWYCRQGLGLSFQIIINPRDLKHVVELLGCSDGLGVVITTRMLRWDAFDGL